MSTLTPARQLRPATCQLPMSWYFDPEVIAREKKLLFDAGANYAGHELMVPEPGDYQTLAWMGIIQVRVEAAPQAQRAGPAACARAAARSHALRHA